MIETQPAPVCHPNTLILIKTSLANILISCLRNLFRKKLEVLIGSMGGLKSARISRESHWFHRPPFADLYLGIHEVSGCPRHRRRAVSAIFAGIFGQCTLLSVAGERRIQLYPGAMEGMEDRLIPLRYFLLNDLSENQSKRWAVQLNWWLTRRGLFCPTIWRTS